MLLGRMQTHISCVIQGQCQDYQFWAIILGFKKHYTWYTAEQKVSDIFTNFIFQYYFIRLVGLNDFPCRSMYSIKKKLLRLASNWLNWFITIETYTNRQVSITLSINYFNISKWLVSASFDRLQPVLDQHKYGVLEPQVWPFEALFRIQEKGLNDQTFVKWSM